MSMFAAVFDRAAHLRKDLDFLEARLSDPSTLLLPVWREQHLIEAGALVLPEAQSAAELLDAGGELVWLGLLGERSCFVVDISRLTSPLAHPALQRAELVDLRGVVMRLTASDVELACCARALMIWHARAQFCGVCGHATRPRDGGHVRACTNAECKAEHFPRTDPCVLALVTHDDRVLLGRQPGWPRGMYSALAGFVEAGETLEQAVAREVAEEAGVEVDPASLRYAGSQSWPMPASLMIGFHARARHDALRSSDELEDARWVSRAELAERRDDFWVPPPATLAGQLIAAFLAGTAPKERA